MTGLQKTPETSSVIGDAYGASPSAQPSPSPSPSTDISCNDHMFPEFNPYPCLSDEDCCLGSCYRPATEICCTDDGPNMGYVCDQDQDCCHGECYDPDTEKCCQYEGEDRLEGEVCDKTDCCEIQPIIGSVCTEAGFLCGEGRARNCKICMSGSCDPIPLGGSLRSCADDGSPCALCSDGDCLDMPDDTRCGYTNSKSKAECKTCSGGTCSGKVTCDPCEECHSTGQGAECISCEDSGMACKVCAPNAIDPVTGNMGMCTDDCKPPNNPCSKCIVNSQNPQGTCESICDDQCDVCKQPENQCHEDTSMCAGTRSECGCSKGGCYSCEEEQSCVFSDMTHHYYCKDPVYA